MFTAVASSQVVAMNLSHGDHTASSIVEGHVMAAVV